MTRILSAAALLAVVFLVTRHAPEWVFLIMVALVAVLAAHEICSLCRRRGLWPQRWVAMAAAALLPLAFFEPRIGTMRMLTLLVLAVPLLGLPRGDDMDRKFGNMMATFFAALFPGLLLGHAVALRGVPGQDGHDLPFLLLLVVAASDTGAYYVGSRMGRHPLAARLSPKKTVEGLVAGLLFGVAGAFLARAWFMHRLTPVDCLVLGAGLAVIGVGGDLVESALKRWAGAKDSSSLIPGHGGILDRIDALLFAAPLLFYYHLEFMETWT